MTRVSKSIIVPQEVVPTSLDTPREQLGKAFLQKREVLILIQLQSI